MKLLNYRIRFQLWAQYNWTSALVLRDQLFKKKLEKPVRLLFKRQDGWMCKRTSYPNRHLIHEVLESCEGIQNSFLRFLDWKFRIEMDLMQQVVMCASKNGIDSKTEALAIKILTHIEQSNLCEELIVFTVLQWA